LISLDFVNNLSFSELNKKKLAALAAASTTTANHPPARMELIMI